MKYKRWVRAEVVIIKQCAGSMTVERGNGANLLI